MPTPRNPILVNVDTTFRDWQVETNALTNIINYFVRSSDGAWVADSAELTNVTISGGTIANVTISGSNMNAVNTTFSGSTFNNATWNEGSIQQTLISDPTVSGSWDFSTATLRIKSGNDTDRLNKGVGTPVEFFYNFSDNLLYIFDGTVAGGRAFSPTAEGTVPDAGQITITDTAGRYDALNVEDALAEIAGAGRQTSETVASNADNITDLQANKIDASRSITAGSGLTGGGTLDADLFISHLNTSEIADVTNSGASGVAITGMQFDDFGHATDRQTYDFDNRYYTETEADARFLNEADNLADLPSAATARENLGLGVDDIVDIGRIDENVVTVSGVSSYNITDTSFNVFAIDTFSQVVTINLPTLADNIGRKIYLMNITAENDIIVNAEAGDTIGADGDSSVTVSPTVTTTILVATESYWEQVSTGGGGASITSHIAATDVTLGQPLSLSPGTQSIAQEVALTGASFSDPIDAYFVLDLATDIKLMVFFADNELDSPPAVGQTHELRVWKSGGFSSIADLISEAATQLINQFGIVYAGTGFQTNYLYIDISLPNTSTISMFTVGSAWSALGTVYETPTVDSKGKVIVGDKRYRYASDIVGIATDAATAGDDIGAQKIARIDELPESAIAITEISDWYLGSSTEVEAMYQELHNDATPLGGFLDDDYWTSTEADANNATRVNFEFGGTNDVAKALIKNVRPIRHFTAPKGAYSTREQGPSGGYIFNIQSGSTLDTYYEAAPADISPEDWGCGGVLVGATGFAIGDGLSNTELIVDNGCGANDAADDAYNHVEEVRRLTAGTPCFLGDTGTILQDSSSINTAEYRVYLGLAIAANSVDVSIEEGIEIGYNPQYWDAHPLGGIAFSSTDALPEGWLRPDGQAISRSSYSELNALYAADGYVYGSGDGASTFNLPNYTDPTLMIKVRNVDTRTATESNDFEQRLQALEGSTGTSLPADEDSTFGEAFYLTTTNQWFKYNGSEWVGI